MPRTGRPRAFKREKAVTAAMNLFWEHGFESTSLSQLRAAMRYISAASFYAAFDSKEALFREAVDRYSRLVEKLHRTSCCQRVQPISPCC